MKYRADLKNGNQLSALGFGGMHVPLDADEFDRLAMHAYQQGINYFDTAYIYYNQKGERLLGDFVKRNGIRDKVYIATKLPTYLIRKAGDIERIFNNELKNLQTNYIDYYLMHMLSDKVTWDRLCKLGIEEWIAEKKQSGQIRNIGFSFHGGKEDFVEIVDAYDWEFTQIQYNYLDENNQAGRSGLEYAAKKGLPVIIMEPLRGGRLVTGLPDDVRETFASFTPQRKPADWALRWLFDHPEISCVLSGMATMEQLDENIVSANEADAHGLSKEEKELFRSIKQSIFEKTKVPCTGCHYCMPCPVGVDIPNCFAVYNDGYLHSMRKARSQYMQATGALTGNPGYASKCIGCGKCESICPQAIPIREKLKDVVREMERFPFRQAMWIARKFVRE